VKNEETLAMISSLLLLNTCVIIGDPIYCQAEFVSPSSQDIMRAIK